MKNLIQAVKRRIKTIRNQEEKMMNLKLEAPWNTFRKKVNALFEHDPDITVGEICESENGKTNYAFDIEVRSHEKFVALDRVLPKVKQFGNVSVGITLYDEENTAGDGNRVDLYRTIFQGNPVVKDIKEAVDFAGTPHGFIRFKPEVLQFFDDDTSDFNGNWSGLAQDIAREIFESECAGIHFCTAALNEE